MVSGHTSQEMEGVVAKFMELPNATVSFHFIFVDP